MVERLRARWRWVGLGAVLVLVSLRAAAPSLIQRYVNHTLDRIPEYDGQIGDVDLALFRGAYTIDDVSLVKTTGNVPVPLFSARAVDLSVERRALFHGEIVGKIVLDEPEINFVSGPTESESQAAVDASCLTNHPEPGNELPAFAHATGRPPGRGSFELETRLDPLAAQPTFKVNASLKETALPSLNDFLKAHGNIDAEGGTVSIYSEIAAENGGFHGYVKPLMKDVQVARFREEESFGRRAWEAIVQLAAKILENPKERVATKIPIRGRFDQAEPDLWAAIGGLLRNAFVQALVPGIEGSVGLPRRGRASTRPKA